MMMAAQRSWGYGVMNILTMSGSPAYFWPVWFQARVRRRARSARMGHVALEKRRVLRVLVSIEGSGKLYVH